jgi:hypothetical protein
MNEFRLLTLKEELLKIYVSIQTAFSVETRLAEGQCLEDQVNMLKLRMFRGGTQRSTVSRGEGQHLVALKALIKNKASK